MWPVVPYIATASALLGSFFQARFKTIGWWLHIVGTLLWITYALYSLDIHFALACAAYLPFEIYGIINWTRKKWKKEH